MVYFSVEKIMKKRNPFLLLLFSFCLISIAAENKTALLIANGQYSNFSRLTTPVNEARQLKASLERLDFKVTLITDASRENMLDGLIDFERDVKTRGGIALFHYGGHAVQVDGKNYLIPADADIPDERRVSTRAVDAEEVMATLEASGSDTNIVILDSCRNNPLPGGGRSASRGLAISGRKPPNSIIVYSAESGTTAQDGVFTPALLSFLEEPGLSFTDILQKTRKKVYEMTNGTQTPGSYDQLFQPIYLSSGPIVHQNPTIISNNSKTVQNNGNMIFVQGGTFSMGSTSGGSDEKPVHSVTVSSFYMDKHEVTQGEYQALMGNNPSDTAKGIGNNYPVNKVNWNEAIEYCNALSRKEGLTPVYSGSGESISMNINANGYRLPTEAEWEFAARGGNASRDYTYSGGNTVGAVGWIRDNSGNKNHPVGGKQANELGLYDMSGNVWEWCWDWYGDYTSGSQSDPVGMSSGADRVLRGGGWYRSSSNGRSANRDYDNPSRRYNTLGFRVVRRP
jgi:sulfatase modifying factor 1